MACKQVELARPTDKNRKRGREEQKMPSNIESHSKLLKDDPKVEMVGAPKLNAQPVIYQSDVNLFFDISDDSSPL